MLSTQSATFLGREFTWVRGLQGLIGILPDEWYMALHRVDPPLTQLQVQTAVRAAKGDAITVKRTSSCPPHLFVEGKHNAYFLSMVGSFQLMAALLQDSDVQQIVLQRRAQDSNVLSLAPFLPALPAPPAPPADPLLLGDVVLEPALPPREPPAAALSPAATLLRDALAACSNVEHAGWRWHVYPGADCVVLAADTEQHPGLLLKSLRVQLHDDDTNIAITVLKQRGTAPLSEACQRSMAACLPPDAGFALHFTQHEHQVLVPCASTQVALRCLLELFSSWSLCPGVTAHSLGAAVDPAFLQYAGYDWMSKGRVIARTEATVDSGDGIAGLIVRSNSCSGFVPVRGGGTRCSECSPVATTLSKRVARDKEPVTLDTRIGPIKVTAKAANTDTRVDTLTQVCNYRYYDIRSFVRDNRPGCVVHVPCCKQYVNPVMPHVYSRHCLFHG